MSVTRSIRILIGCLLCGLIVSTWTSCHSPTTDAVSDQDTIPSIFLDLDSILQRGRIRALTDNSSTSYFVYKGLPMGYEYELLQSFADHLGVELELVVVSNMDSIFDRLNRFEGDIVAANITVTKDRSELVDFSERLLTTRQVLIQRLPQNSNNLKLHQIDRKLVRNQLDLIGKTVTVRKNSSFYTRLRSLSDELGGEIFIDIAPGHIETEELIEQVADGTIDYTIADENVARLNKVYHPGIDIKTVVSFPQQIAWAVRKSSPSLKDTLDQWITTNRHTSDFATIFTKYFRSRSAQRDRVKSDYSSLYGGKISPYDDLIREFSDSLGWDWRLLAAVVYQESKFDLEAESWMGARGLMQILPATAELMGFDSIQTPRDNLHAGSKYLHKLNQHWVGNLQEPDDRIKFVLGSYNVGLGHIIDARRLAQKNGYDPNRWDGHVAYFLTLKSQPAYYNDEVVKHGYCRGSEPVRYVREILNRYDHYQNAIN